MKNDVGYLIKRINDKLAARADAELKQFNLTMSQCRVFLYLSSRGGQATQKEIETFWTLLIRPLWAWFPAWSRMAM